MKKNRLDNPYTLMSILLVLWGSFAAVSKMALERLDNYQVQFYMFGSAVVIFTVMFSLNGRIKTLLTLRPKEIGKLLLYGLPYYLYYLFYILSLGLIPVVEASMLNYMFPVFVVLLSVPMFGERLTLAKGFSILLGFVGMMAIVSNGDMAAIRLTNLGGDLLALGGALSWALFSGLGRKNKVDQDLSMYIFTLSAFAFSSIGLLGFSTFTVPNPTGLGLAVCLGISNIVLGNFLWIHGLKSSSSSLIASLSYLTPFVTLLFIIVMLGERLSVPQTVGFLIISAGIVIQVVADKIAVRSRRNQMTHFMNGKLKVLVYPDVTEMAKAVAEDVRFRILSLLQEKAEINIVFSGAKSQQTFHQELAKFKDINWKRINAFAVDEFYCPGMNPEYTVAKQPIRDLYSVVSPKSVNIINYNALDPEAERKRYEDLISNHPADIACLGIGISGHIALNEPGQTDFDDKLSVRVVDVTAESKAQLMNDPNFIQLGYIPDKGITITLPELMKCANVYVIVPFSEKAEIINKFLKNGITADLPASIVKLKENAVMYLDDQSYGLYQRESC